MKANEFDKAIRHSYDQGNFEYNPAQWENMVQRLNEAESKKTSLAWLLPFISYAASILFMVSIGAFLMRKNAAQDRIAANGTSLEQGLIFTQPQVQHEPAWQNTTAADAPNTGLQDAQSKKTVNILQHTGLPQEDKIAIMIPNDAENVLNAALAIVVQPVQHIIHKAPAYIDLSGPVYEPMEENKTRKTIISVSGGLNYGAANSGYALGFTAYQKLADNFFFEGDVAFVNNLGGKRTEFTTESSYAAATSVVTSQVSSGSGGGVGKGNTAAKPSGSSPNASGTAARPSGISPTEDETMQTTTTVVQTQPRGSHYNLFYAQVTPTVGYNVFKNLSLSGGADVQRLLQDEKLMTVTEHEVDAKYVPTYDLGFVGKTEYAISKELKATVYYRHGLNNAINGGASEKYIDRNYIQLQLKFSILNK